MDTTIIVQWIKAGVDMILHLDVHLNTLMAQFGSSMYWILFLIIFCETGLVITPFLPGDSLLFALGALCASPHSVLDVWTLWGLLIVAGILGDAVNYTIGAKFGSKLFTGKLTRFLNPEHLAKTQRFYERYGGKTIILARFIPIVRTFAPFVAGIGTMSYPRFAAYNIIGAFLWVSIFLFAGFYFGNLPQVKSNFHIIIVAIIIVSVMPAIFEWWRARRT